jgi:hypothetical protein
MDFEINLLVNPRQLKKYRHGFGYDTTIIDECITTNTKVPAVFIYEVKDVEEGILLLKEFDRLVEEANIVQHRDDLLYYILCANEMALCNLNIVAEEWANDKPKALKHKAKELAQLMLLYKENRSLTKIDIKFTPGKGQPLTIKSDLLKHWIHELINQAATNNQFTQYGPNHYFGFLTPDELGNLNYDLVRSVADMPIGALSIDSKKIATQFISEVNTFVSNEGIFAVGDGVRYSSTALTFIYQICLLFNWLKDEDRDSTDVDYMHALIANYRRLHPDN